MRVIVFVIRRATAEGIVYSPITNSKRCGWTRSRAASTLPIAAIFAALALPAHSTIITVEAEERIALRFDSSDFSNAAYTRRIFETVDGNPGDFRNTTFTFQTPVVPGSVSVIGDTNVAVSNVVISSSQVSYRATSIDGDPGTIRLQFDRKAPNGITISSAGGLPILTTGSSVRIGNGPPFPIEMRFTIPGNWSKEGTSSGSHTIRGLNPAWTIDRDFTYNGVNTSFLASLSNYTSAKDAEFSFRLYGTPLAPPAIPSFGPIDVPFQRVEWYSAPGYSLSFQDSRFLVDFPLFLDSAVDSTNPRISSLLDGWISTINDLWGSHFVKDQYGRSFAFSFNAHLVDDRDASLSTIRLHDIVGSNNASCRKSRLTASERANYDSVFSECPIPSIVDNVMYMPTSLQSFCFDHECSPSYLTECRNIDGSVISFSLCEDLNGDFLKRVAAHEFGHLLGLPDEYAPNSKDTLCLKGNPLNLDCSDRGLMEAIDLDPMQRYFDYLFSNLDNFTPGFELSFVPDPDWTSPVPILGQIGSIEISPATFVTAEIPVPATLVLLSVGLIAVGASRRNVTAK